MTATHTDLVINISTARPASKAPGGEKVDEAMLVIELQRYLQPGSEIEFVFGGYLAITSILWLSGTPAGSGLCAGVRLIGVSAHPTDKRPDPPISCGDAQQTKVCEHSISITRHGS